MKNRFRTTRVTLLLCAAIGVATTTARAYFVDPLDDTNNFFGAFGGVFATNTAPSEVTLFKPDPIPGGEDAGIDWRNGGAGGVNFSLSTAGTESVFVIRPVAPVNGGYYNVTILFFSNATLVAQVPLIADTNLSDAHTNDIAAFAFQNGVIADEWYPRIRVLPFDFDGADRGFSFTELAAIPEPTSLALLLVTTMLGAWFRRRR